MGICTEKNERREIKRYKAWLVAKGCSQRFGIDYSDTFSPVVRYSSIRLVFALAVHLKMYLHQIDISSAYLNNEIHHDLYLRQPQMFKDVKSPRKVLKLNKAIYGLRQYGKEWYDKLTSVFVSLEFEQCKHVPCLYKSNINNHLVLVAIYVDDLLNGCAAKTQTKQS